MLLLTLLLPTSLMKGNLDPSHELGCAYLLTSSVSKVTLPCSTPLKGQRLNCCLITYSGFASGRPSSFLHFRPALSGLWVHVMLLTPAVLALLWGPSRRYQPHLRLCLTCACLLPQRSATSASTRPVWMSRGALCHAAHGNSM